MADEAAIWRNGVTNTVAVIDLVRKQHQPTRANKAYDAFDAALDEALGKWFEMTRLANPQTYEEAEAVWKEYAARLQGVQNG